MILFLFIFLSVTGIILLTNDWIKKNLATDSANSSPVTTVLIKSQEGLELPAAQDPLASNLNQEVIENQSPRFSIDKKIIFEAPLNEPILVQ